MSWVAELRQAFSHLLAGGPAHVSFAVREDSVGELGREFNSLANGLEQPSSSDGARERLHRQRNQLAGILAALHVLRETGDLTPEEQATLNELLQEAKTLEARWRLS